MRHWPDTLPAGHSHKAFPIQDVLQNLRKYNQNQISRLTSLAPWRLLCEIIKLFIINKINLNKILTLLIAKDFLGNEITILERLNINDELPGVSWRGYAKTSIA